MDLQYLLKPKSVAIVGASEKLGMGQGTCVNILRFQENTEQVYFVHPQNKEVFGRECYKSLQDIPVDIDLVVICTSQAAVPKILNEAILKGCKAAVVYASGYADGNNEQGRKHEDSLVQIAKNSNMVIMGPNCGGFVNFVDSIFAFAFEGNYADKRGKVGMISQSGQFCIDMMNAQDIRYSYMISSGNGNIVSMEDYLEFLVEDEETHVIAIYMEGIKKPKNFCGSLRKAAMKGKPVVVLKGGRSPEGAANVSSHTGSIAGKDETFEAVFQKYGVIRVVDLQDLRSTVMLLSTLRNYPKRAHFAAMCMSGGETAICADTGFHFGLKYPKLADQTLSKLKQVLPYYTTPNNPLDLTVTMSYSADKFAECIQAVMADESIDIGIIGYTITEKKPTEPEFIMFEGIKKAVANIEDKPLVVIPFVEGTRYSDFANRFIELGIPILAAPQYAFLALKHLGDYIDYRPDEHDLRDCAPEYFASNSKRILCEYDSRAYLRDNGISIDLVKLAYSAKEAVSVARDIGYPVVLKINSTDIPHKTEADCVKLDICSDGSVLDAYNAILENAHAYNPNAKINGIIVQKMYEGGLEVMLGLSRDQQFGPMIMVGLGGIYVELFSDVALSPTPISELEAYRMIESLRSYKVFDGFRGLPGVDKEALVNLMMQLSTFACNHRNSVLELDLNPVFVFEHNKGLRVGDALLILDTNEIS